MLIGSYSCLIPKTESISTITVYNSFVSSWPRLLADEPIRVFQCRLYITLPTFFTLLLFRIDTTHFLFITKASLLLIKSNNYNNW